MPRVMLIDPLTLLGRELLGRLEASPLQPTVEYRHTSDDEEHQIAELGGQAALVPPLEGADELVGFDAVVVASDGDSPRLDHVAALLEGGPDSTLVVDAAATRRLRELTRPALPGDDAGELGAVRVAHPALLATARIAAALAQFAPSGGSLLALDPASARGDAAIEQLARQAVARLQGQTPEELIDEQVLAFGLVPQDALELAEDAGVVCPGLDLVVSRALMGLFHGHVFSLALDLADEMTTSDLVAALEEDPWLAVVEAGRGVEQAMDTDRVVVLPPALSRSGRRCAVTAMADGLRLTAAGAWQLALPHLSVF